MSVVHALRGPRLAAKARLRWDKRDACYMLLYPERGMTLNDTAVAILKKCDGTRSVDELIDELTSEAAGASASAVRADVVAFLDEMRKRGLLDEAP